jgi:CRISPR/Cas system-associated endonuclease/helicase Cas3
MNKTKEEKQYTVFLFLNNKFMVDSSDYRLVPLEEEEEFELSNNYDKPLYLYDILAKDFQDILNVMSLEEQELFIDLTMKAVRHSNMRGDKYVKE